MHLAASPSATHLGLSLIVPSDRRCSRGQLVSYAVERWEWELLVRRHPSKSEMFRLDLIVDTRVW